MPSSCFAPLSALWLCSNWERSAPNDSVVSVLGVGSAWGSDAGISFSMTANNIVARGTPPRWPPLLICCPSESPMLLELRAENYAVIDHAIAGFGPGLNLLTGETGAGKSILVDALALLMGQKASTDIIRHGADRAVLSCVFEATAGAELILEANGIDAEGAEIILRREILDNGKGRVY